MPIDSGDGYQAYLLRMWRDADHAPWRASLQVVTTGHVYTFVDLKALFRFIEKSTGPDAPPYAHHAAENEV